MGEADQQEADLHAKGARRLVIGMWAMNEQDVGINKTKH